LDDFRRKERGTADLHESAIVAVNDMGRDIDFLQVLSKVRFGERLDSIVGSFRADLQADPPKSVAKD
jgi:hypothetical protein